MTRRHIFVLALLLLGTFPVCAQSFLDHLQKEDQGQGSVSVKQSDDISNLVNGKGKQKDNTPAQPKTDQRSSSQTPPRQATQAPRDNTPSRQDSRQGSQASGSTTSGSTEQSAAERERQRERQRREDAKMKEEARQRALQTRDDYSSTSSAPARSSVKKVMRGGRRMNGYMVQVWAGANTREDKQKAEQVGQEMKSKMPNLPVYVHFYSPRWACRVGNFAKQDDASDLVKKLKKMGYRGACVVKASLIVRRTKYY